jgi:hypothetical protein
VKGNGDMEREKFEKYAESIGLRTLEANCRCCTYFYEDTEIAYQAWNAAIESVLVQPNTIKTNEPE